LSLRGSDIDVKIESNTTGRQETALTLAILDAEFADRTDQSDPNVILSRTTPLSLTVNTVPLLQLRFSSLTHPQSGLKETGIRATVSSSTIFVHHDYTWAKDLALFAKTPEGVFEDVVPAEITRIGISIHNCSIHAKSPKLDGALVVVLGSMEGKTDIESGAESRGVEVGIGNMVVLVVDDLAATSSLQGGLESPVEAYLVCSPGFDMAELMMQRAGYAQLANLVTLDVQVMQDLAESGETLVGLLCQLMGTGLISRWMSYRPSSRLRHVPIPSQRSVRWQVKSQLDSFLPSRKH
jgi:autophagy-related protein 2